MKIAFLFNHDATHQMPHTIPVALALARRGIQIQLLSSSQGQTAALKDLIPPELIDRILEIKGSAISEILDGILGKFSPFRRVAVLKENIALLGQFDVIIVPETTTTLLKSRYGPTKAKLVYIPHGAGDGSAGFRAPTKLFDLVLLSGKKVRNRMLQEGLISLSNHSIIGYPKFDLIKSHKDCYLFDNNKPVVLYNPHFNPFYSSWYSVGNKVLEWFGNQSDYNLIFAPHVMLFKRDVHISVEHKWLRWRTRIRGDYSRNPGIVIDPGSMNSINMYYSLAADVYLGDISSQIYEWCFRPRPAIFFNTRGVTWSDDPCFRHWYLGDVIGSIDELASSLKRAMNEPFVRRDAQRRAFAETFDIQEKLASERAADAILSFMSNECVA